MHAFIYSQLYSGRHRPAARAWRTPRSRASKLWHQATGVRLAIRCAARNGLAPLGHASNLMCRSGQNAEFDTQLACVTSYQKPLTRSVVYITLLTGPDKVSVGGGNDGRPPGLHERRIRVDVTRVVTREPVDSCRRPVDTRPLFAKGTPGCLINSSVTRTYLQPGEAVAANGAKRQ